MRKKHKLWVLALSFAIFVLSSIDASAIEVIMESPRFRIQGANINTGGKDQSSSGYELSTTLGQLAAGKFQSDGYVVKAGFQYIHSIIPFQFSLSSTAISFGELIPNNPVTGSTTMSVSFGNAGQYQVTAGELGPLQTLSGSSIPDTSCDGGSDTCDESTAKPWTSSNAYGFGYSLQGNDIPVDFTDNTRFRPFPDLVAGETAAVVMTNSNVGKNRQATMTFKANVSNIQQAGTYQTVINYVATPSF